MPLSPTVWIGGVLCAATVVLVVPRLQQADTPRVPCTPIDPALLVQLLDDNQREAADDFLARAERLKAEGRCVVEGGWSSRRQSFFYAIDTNGNVAQREYIWLTREQLKP